MIALITVVILLACVVLAFFVLIQNPKGGGLAGNFGSLGNQVMGVKQSTDVMEKGTWGSIAVVALLCIISVMFFETPKELQETKGSKQKSSAPAQQAPANNQQAPAKK